MSFHDTQLKWIQWIQYHLRGPVLDRFFIGWDYVDTGGFFVLFLAAVIYLCKRKEGISLLFIFIISGIVNLSLKQYFQLPRPCHILASIGVVCHSSFGFPSGAAQTATILAGLASARLSNNLARTGTFVFAFFLCFSRIYLGVHFFTDILGGIASGLFLLAIYLWLFPYFEKRWGLFSLALAVIFFSLGGLKLLPQAAMALGIGLGLFFDKEEPFEQCWRFRTFNFLTVVIGTFFFIYLGDTYPAIKPFMTFLAGLWFIFLGSYLSNRSFHFFSAKKFV